MNDSQVKKKICIAIACYNEEDNIENMYNALCERMNKWNKYDFEIIFADNHSVDNSESILRKIAEQDKRVKVILNMQNFGPSRSGANLLSVVDGDAVITLPCDFQEPPALIDNCIEEWENGYEVVFLQKKSSKESKLKYVCRNIYYKIMDIFSDYKQVRQITGYGLTDKKVNILVKEIIQNDIDCHIRHLVLEYGFKLKLVEYTQERRKSGKSSYSLSKYFEFAVSTFCSISLKPLHIMTFAGFIISCLSIVSLILYLIYKIINWDSFRVGMAPFIIVMVFMSGIQIFCLGLIGEYISVLVKRSSKKPYVIEKERINF